MNQYFRSARIGFTYGWWTLVATCRYWWAAILCLGLGIWYSLFPPTDFV